MNPKLPRAFPGRRPSPFLGSEAVRAGMLTAHALRTDYRAVFRNVYLPNDVALTPLLRAQAAWLFTGPDAVLNGLSAAAVHGAKYLDPNAPAEVIRPNRHAPAGLRVRWYALAPEDICTRDDMRVTTAARTAFDLGRLLSRDAAIPGLETAIPFYDEWDLECTRIAMGWRRWKVAVGCDEESGAPGYRHQVTLKTAELESRGWDLLWVTWSMLRYPNQIRNRVQQKLWAAHDRERLRAPAGPG